MHRDNKQNGCGCGYRDFNTEYHEPCCLRADCKYAELARQHDRLITHIIKAVTRDRQRGLDYEIAMENPMGTLRKRMPILANDVWQRLIELKTVDYCAYDHEYQKRTDIFTTLKDWTPQGTTGSGRCEQKCGHGSVKLRYEHFENMYNVVGSRGQQRKNAVPAMLLTEILEQVKEKQPRKSVVVDLCSGYQSMRRPAELMGFNYIAVDIRDCPRVMNSTTIEGEGPSVQCKIGWTHLYKANDPACWCPCVVEALTEDRVVVKFRHGSGEVDPSLLIDFDESMMDTPWQ